MRLLNATAQMLLDSEMFFQNFSKNLSTKKFKKFETTNSKIQPTPSAYTLASQILPPNMNAQILLVFEKKDVF